MVAQEMIASLGDTSSILNNLNGRMRLIEERFMQLRENLELLNENLMEERRDVLINENLMEERRDVLKRVKNLDNEIKNLKKENLELTNTINHIIKEVGLFARKDSVRVLEKYISMWDPLKFTTEEDVKKIIEGQIKKTVEKSEEEGVESAK